MNKDNSENDVIVVGGGASGIYASMILKKNGLRPLILEAQQNPTKGEIMVNVCLIKLVRNRGDSVSILER